MDPHAIDAAVRRVIYEVARTTGRPPSAGEVARESGLEHDAVCASFERLAAGRMLVLQEPEGEILMAPPWSAVPTPFRVIAGGVAMVLSPSLL